MQGVKVKHLYIFDSEENGLANNFINASKKLYRKAQHRHELAILTCYFDIEAIRKLIEELTKEVKLTEIYIIVDAYDVNKIGVDVLEDEFNEMGIDFRIDCSKKLLHTKAYRLRQYTTKGKWAGGIMIVSSGNATNNGLYGINTELGYLSDLKKDLDDFDKLYDDIWKKAYDLDKFKERKRVKTRYYDLLASGVFLHKWEGNLNQLFSAKYIINEEAISEMEQDEDLKEWGVKFGKTLSISVFDFSEIKQYKISKEFFKKFTIETYLGRWCPISAWIYINNCLKKKDSIGKKQKILRSKLSSLNEAKRTLKYRQDRLLDKKYIKQPKSNHIATWEQNVKKISSQSDVLFERLLTGYESFKLPYNENDDEIEELYNSLLQSAEISRRKCVIKKWLIEKGNSVSYTLSKDDESTISKWV
jgi:hypothetical protein